MLDNLIATADKLLGLVGSANFAKVAGMLQAALAGTTAADGKTLTAHVSGMTIGAAFTLLVHGVDAVRAKIGR